MHFYEERIYIFLRVRIGSRRLCPVVAAISHIYCSQAHKKIFDLPVLKIARHN